MAAHITGSPALLHASATRVGGVVGITAVDTKGTQKLTFGRQHGIGPASAQPLALGGSGEHHPARVGADVLGDDQLGTVGRTAERPM